MNGEVSLERLNRQLAMSWMMLGDCSRLIRDLELNHEENIRRIGNALLLIFDILDQIYEQRPDLTPEHVKKEWNRPRSATEGAKEVLARLREEVHGHRLYVEYLERQISELEGTIK
jgi:hypothetical protein